MRTVSASDPNDVIAFLEVADRGSFRGAARALGIPKSTLSQRVADLEAHLNARLFTRTTRTVALTDIGASYQREVAPAIAALRQADTLVSKLQSHPTGRLRMTAAFELGQRALGPVLVAYARRYPEVKIDLELSDRRVNIVEEGFDLAVRFGPLGDSRLIARRLAEPLRGGIFGSPEYLRRAGTPKVPRDLNAHACLVMSGAQSPSTWSFAGTRTKTLSLSPHLSVNSYQVLVELTLAGVGLSRLPSLYLEEHVTQGRLKEVLAPYAPPPVQLFAVYPSARHVSPAVRAMLEVLQAHFKETPWGAR